jgi:glycosyltransferase involved in cell wall biosynthesis
MKILISSNTLDLSGVPTYTLSLYEELVKRGHKVQVYSPKAGPLMSLMEVCVDLDMVNKPDVIIGHHRDCSAVMREGFPGVPLIFSAHGVEPEGEQPPNFEADWYTAINEETFKNLVFKGVSIDKITIVRDFVDTKRFSPLSPLNDVLKRVLFISNRKKWKTYAIIRKVCKYLDWDFTAVGSPYGRSYFIEQNINNSDLVIGSGRALLEAMSCGRPVISFDKGVGDGYFTENVYRESRTHNFCGAQCEFAFDEKGLLREMEKYSPEDGKMNREIILVHHNVVDGVDLLLSIIKRLL